MEGILKGRKKEILNSVSTLERGKSEEEEGGGVEWTMVEGGPGGGVKLRGSMSRWG